MSYSDIASEIQTSSARISSREAEIKLDIIKLSGLVNKFTNWAWFFVAFGFVVAIVGIILYVSSKSSSDFSLNLLGDFMAGAVTSLWSLSGLFFIYVAFLGQKQQILYQQLEIMYSQLEVKYTRLELEGQKREMIEQNKTLKYQRFENTFFQLVRNHTDIVNSIDLRKHSGGGGISIVSQGRDCFKTFYEKFRNSLQWVNDRKNIEVTKQYYQDFFLENQSDLGHYFRHLYHILKFVNDTSEIPQSEKFRYTSLLRSLLSSYELALIFYNGIGPHGMTHMKPLMEKYSFLKNIDKNILIHISHTEAYERVVYLSSEERKLQPS